MDINNSSQAAIQKAASIQKAKMLYTGEIINGIQFLEPTERSVKGDGILWRCKCIHCGKELITSRKMARRRKVCACQKLPSVRQEDYTERIGKKYGRLTLLTLAGVDSKNHMLGVFQCECGRIVKKRLESVFHGRTASCGCLRSEQAAINLSNY